MLYVEEYPVTNPPPEAKKPRSRRIYVMWGVALTVLAIQGCRPHGRHVSHDSWGGRTIHHYKDGQLHGERLYIAPNGRTVQLITYKNGKRDGPRVEWFPNGKVAARGINRDGKPWSGEFQVVTPGVLYGEHGYIRTNIRYENGKRVPTSEVIEWDREGNVVSKGRVKEADFLSGGTPWEGFFLCRDGKRVTTKYFKEGRLVKELPRVDKTRRETK
jgi:antitoxin component YwqK of YwqJK toxin-antitoxin module